MAEMAVRAWNLMDGEIQWTAVPFFAEWLGCDDLDGLIGGLITIRAYGIEKRKREENAGRRPND